MLNRRHFFSGFFAGIASVLGMQQASANDGEVSIPEGEWCDEPLFGDCYHGPDGEWVQCWYCPPPVAPVEHGQTDTPDELVVVQLPNTGVGQRD